MPSIAGYEVTGWRGRLRPAEMAIDVEDAQPGVDGHIASLGAYRSPRAEIITIVDVNDIKAVTDLVNAYRRLYGTSVTVIDPTGVTWSGVFIAGMSPEWDMKASGGFRVTAVWSLVPQSSIPP
jgi:hypothetical protein